MTFAEVQLMLALPSRSPRSPTVRLPTVPPVQPTTPAVRQVPRMGVTASGRHTCPVVQTA